MKTEQTPRLYSSAKDLMERTEKELSKGDSAHTPGPWQIHDTDVGLEIHPSSDDDGLVVIADVNGRHEANARLIAAAPELLAACKRVLDVITGDQAAELGIYTAIRSAEGRSNE